MQLVTCQGGVLRTLSVRRLPGSSRAFADAIAPEADAPANSPDRSFTTGLAALDALPPGRAFARGAVHELLWAPGHVQPRTFALLLARSAAVADAASSGAVVWCDPKGELYPPAVAAAGLPLERLFLLRPRTDADALWAVAECLGARGVAATIAAPPRLTRVQARRLQLAAERGGGVGLLLRCTRDAQHYAAVTRWLVAPVRGEPAVQRWKAQLVHGHGGQVGKAVILEVCRDAGEPGNTGSTGPAHHVCAFDAVADRPAPPQVARASA